MNINFKIFCHQYENWKNNIVILKGDLSSFNWNTLKEKIIYNSNQPYLKHNQLDINENDIFKLKIIQGHENEDLNDIKEIFDERTFNYLVAKLKEIKNKNIEEKIIIKFNLIKIKELPKINLPIYDIVLRDALINSWNKEKERIKKELNEIELTKSNIDYLNKFFMNKKLPKQMNKNIICNDCGKIDFYGPRYVCTYCTNFNLCYLCYKKNEHDSKHNFIIFKTPTQNEENINIFNIIVNPKKQIFHNKKESFKAKFKLFNNGESNLKDCFITYIKFDDNNLICKKYTIKDDFVKDSMKEIELEINFNDLSSDFYYNYEGHFRMFNKYGIPFGDIFIVKIYNDSLRNI